MPIIDALSDFGLLIGHAYLMAVIVATAVALGAAVFAVSVIVGP